MSQFTASVILEGRSLPSQTPVRLRAGPLTMLLEPANGFLRQIRFGDALVLNGIYAAVRDHNWDTVEPAIRDLIIDQKPEAFAVRFTAECRRDGIDFRWQGTIAGDAGGAIRYSFDGVARSEFARNRVGFCVLHGAECAGQACLVEHVDGSRTTGAFPDFISPHQPFKGIRAITHEISVSEARPGTEASAPPGGSPAFAAWTVNVRMEGEVFEMEDQRNWTDASFKTYCTPLELPFPVALKPGNRFQQTVELQLRPVSVTGSAETGAPGTPARKEPGRSPAFQRPFTVETNNDARPGQSAEFHPLPRLGLGMASHDLPLNEREVERLQALQLDHLRCDLVPATGNWGSRWSEAVRQATALDCRLHVAVHLDAREAPDRVRRSATLIGQLEELARLAEEVQLVDAWLIFVNGERSTGSKWTELARPAFHAAGGLVVGGTNAGFAELNRNRPAPGSADAITWPVNPQVHAFDDLSLVESLAAQWETVRSAREFFEGGLMISPVTLRPRFNPNATAAAPDLPPDVLPPQVDVRQMSLFGAAWTLGSIASLSRAPILRALTYYETTGWRGVMEWSDRPRLPHRFVTRPNWVFPIYFVFALLAGHDECQAVPVPDPLVQSALLVRRQAEPGRVRLLVASFAREATQFALPEGFEPDRGWKLDQENAVEAMRNPVSALAQGWESMEGNDPITLPPFGLMAMDGSGNRNGTAGRVVKTARFAG